MGDTISRKQAIDAMGEYFARIGKLKRRGLNVGEKAIALDVVGTLKSLPPALSTNLAEVGTDMIDRQQAIDALRNYLIGKNVPCDGTMMARLIENEVINKLPSAQPDIVRCRDCRYYNHEEKECLDLLGYGRRWEEDDFCSYAER